MSDDRSVYERLQSWIQTLCNTASVTSIAWSPAEADALDAAENMPFAEFILRGSSFDTFSARHVGYTDAAGNPRATALRGTHRIHSTLKLSASTQDEVLTLLITCLDAAPKQSELGKVHIEAETGDIAAREDTGFSAELGLQFERDVHTVQEIRRVPYELEDPLEEGEEI